jgi:hypothetical protein
MNPYKSPAFRATLVAASILAWAPPALACLPPLLCAPIVPFAAGSVIPASASAIPVVLAKDKQTGNLAQAQLIDADGKPALIEVVEDSAWGWHLIKPLKGLKAGASYTLRLESGCQEPGAATPTQVDTPFTTGPAAELPSSFGTLALTAQKPSTLTVATYAGSCVVPLLAARADVELAHSPDLDPWLALSRAELWVDGQLWSQSAYGALPLAGGAAPPPTGPGGRNVHRFHVPCQVVPNGADKGVDEGLHHVDLRIFVAGTKVPAPYLWGDVEVSCNPAAPADAGSAADGLGDTQSGGDSAAAAETTDAADSGSLADGTSGAAPAPMKAAAGGCAAGQPAQSGAWWLLAVALFWARKRRWPSAL